MARIAPRKAMYADGAQGQMFPPQSDWQTPTELPDLRRAKEIGIDTETRDDGLAQGRGPGWVYRAGKVVGVSVAWGNDGDERGIYMPIAHPDSDNLDPANVRQWLLDHRHLAWVMHNAPYDLGWMRAAFDIPAPDQIHDTTALSVMLDEHWPSYSLDEVAKRCGFEGKNETLLKEAAACWGLHPKKDLWRLPARFVGPYAEDDAIVTLKVKRQLLPAILEEGSLEAYQLEMDLIPMIQEMRWRGIRVDVDRAEASYIELLRKRDAVFAELSDNLGMHVGMEEIGKTRWLASVFDANGIGYPRTRTGMPSFTSGQNGWMDKHEHWLPRLITKADVYNNAAVKFVKGFILDYSHNGRLHASINQFMSEDDVSGGKTGTKTHRFSYSDPALQQMPSRVPEMKALIRACFLPEPGELWCKIDYAQQEYRLMVHFAKLLNLPKAAEAAQKYIDDPDTDFHQLVADLTGLARGEAKNVNFAKAYGAGVTKFAIMTGMPEEQAARVMGQYDDEMPFIKDLGDYVKGLAARRGWIRLIDGARLHFPFWEGPWMEYRDREALIRAGWELNPCRIDVAHARQENPDHPWHGKRLRRADTRKAMNGLIQGSAARQTKKAMLMCWREGIVPLLQLHDELDFSLSKKSIGDKAARMMSEAVKLEIPVGADCEWGVNWARAAKGKDGYKASFEEASHELRQLSPVPAPRTRKRKANAA